MASSSAANGAQATIGHEGVANVTINQESVNQLMEGAQAIEAASAGVNEGTGIECQTLTEGASQSRYIRFLHGSGAGRDDRQLQCCTSANRT